MAALLGLAALALAGCESGRFGGRGGPSAGVGRPAAADPMGEPSVSAIPSGSVTAEPLAPLPGGAAPPPVMPGNPQPVEVVGGGGGGPPAGPGSRSAAVGGWTARDQSGASCRVNLSSSPSLDLYRASASGCANKDLAKVTAWDFRDGEVYLYQPGGAVAARLRSASGGLSGVMSRSGAPLTLTRG